MLFNEEKTDTSLVGILSEIPKPIVSRNIDPETRKYIDNLHHYLSRVISMLTPQAIARGLPEVPDLTKKYHLIFDPADKLIKWEEII